MVMGQKGEEKAALTLSEVLDLLCFFGVEVPARLLGRWGQAEHTLSHFVGSGERGAVGASGLDIATTAVGMGVVRVAACAELIAEVN